MIMSYDQFNYKWNSHFVCIGLFTISNIVEAFGYQYRFMGIWNKSLRAARNTISLLILQREGVLSIASRYKGRNQWLSCLFSVISRNYYEPLSFKTISRSLWFYRINENWLLTKLGFCNNYMLSDYERYEPVTVSSITIVKSFDKQQRQDQGK